MEYDPLTHLISSSGLILGKVMCLFCTLTSIWGFAYGCGIKSQPTLSAQMKEL